MKTLLVILGAAIGAPARFAIDQYIRKFTDKPYGILLVNVLGSFVFGLTMKSAENTYALFAIGFAGAFTTWSTFMLDFFLAYELKKYKDAAINLSASLVIGLLAASLGMSLA
jgi:CrcB protein